MVFAMFVVTMAPVLMMLPIIFIVLVFGTNGGRLQAESRRTE
jgi:hypothetical protein